MKHLLQNLIIGAEDVMRKCDRCRHFFDSARKREGEPTCEETPDMKQVICDSGISSPHSMMICIHCHMQVILDSTSPAFF